ncbi:MAG TPA: glycosyltransferase [Burkholderiales bacterium]|nr:glycosyltransferase [Burkholderiales bacterium]
MNRSIIAHCHLRWNFVWQRPQHIFSRLAAHHRILLLEEAEYEAGHRPLLRLSEPSPGLVRAIPVLPERLGVDQEAPMVLPLVRAALERHPMLAGHFDQPVHWFYSPMGAPHFIGQFGEAAVVYDCMDELANFRFAPPDIAERERFLMSHADVVFTGGRSLFDAKSRHHRNTHFFGCGVDVEHFGAALDANLAGAPELAALPRPVLGYFGVIDERLDYALIARLAAAFPQGSVVMVGPLAKVDAAELPQAPNLHWLGQRSYAELPALVKRFDVCLMPFALNEATRYINPTKTLEYMAAGKPVVSTAVPDVVRNFGRVVDVAQSPEDFVLAAARAIQAPRPAAIAQGLTLARESTWDAIVASMRKQMLAAVRQPKEIAA